MAVLLLVAAVIGAIGVRLRQPLFVLIGNPLIVMIILGAMGYRKRTGFLAGPDLGHIDTDTMGLITLVGLITISASTYMILYSHPLYERLSPWRDVADQIRQLVESNESASMLFVRQSFHGRMCAHSSPVNEIDVSES